MAYTSSALHARDIPRTKTRKGHGWLTRVFDLFMAARTRHAEREIARYLRSSGGKFTDDVEREIERRFLSHQSRW